MGTVCTEAFTSMFCHVAKASQFSINVISRSLLGFLNWLTKI